MKRNRLFKMAKQIVSSDELSRMIPLLRRSNKPLRDVVSSFVAKFDRAEVFRLGMSLCMLLQDDLLTRTERVVAFFLLHEVFREKGGEAGSNNPFTQFFIHGVERKDVDIGERVFISKLLVSKDTHRELGKRSASGIISEFYGSVGRKERSSVGGATANSGKDGIGNRGEIISSSEIQKIKKAYQSKSPRVPRRRAGGGRPIILDRREPQGPGGASPALSWASSLSAEQIFLITLTLAMLQK